MLSPLVGVKGARSTSSSEVEVLAHATRVRAVSLDGAHAGEPLYSARMVGRLTAEVMVSVTAAELVESTRIWRLTRRPLT